ncbi:MAG TPA: hypothetical protein VK464_12280 [Symbiobacteriaceae bacterium]|jgi:hypothetical protein|nr:hypothetical protein [Symbiobacteriaceae bacterium]
MLGWFPGYPGPLSPSGGIGGVALPAMPMLPGGQPLTTTPPLHGLAARGVPVGQTPTGQAVLQSSAASGFIRPPEIAGMPGMPALPEAMMAGGPWGGGLMQPVQPVLPFDHGNMVRQHQVGEWNPAQMSPSLAP